jgi:hypothetical protein
MGVQHDDGYSADVEGFLIVGGDRMRIAKTNSSTFVLAELRALAPHVEGELLLIVDGKKHSRRVTLPNGVVAGDRLVHYKVIAPF